MTEDPLSPRPRRRLTDKERAYYRFFHDQVMQFEWDLRHLVWNGLILPSAWHEVLKEPGPREKTRVTLRLDADLVKFFRATGRGWQPRLNTVVRAYVMARLAKLAEGPESYDAVFEPKGDRVEIGWAESVIEGTDETKGDGAP